MLYVCCVLLEMVFVMEPFAVEAVENRATVASGRWVGLVSICSARLPQQGARCAEDDP